MDRFIGLRPGELLECKHACEFSGGCGTSKHCKTCGAVISILSSQNTGKSVKSECHMTISRNNRIECIDFLVHVTPVTLGEYKLLTFVLQDISSVKRREVLERVFLHDINNILTGLMGWSEVLQKSEEAKAAKKIVELTTYLKHEFDYQQIIYLAEKKELTVKKTPVEVEHIISQMESLFINNKLKKDRNIVFHHVEEKISFNTDITLLIRVLINMVKNALEATEKKGTVEIYCQKHDRELVFSVHNKGVIPEDVALNIFKRSFTTKEGIGRGIGTYSMKLFGENYLGGTVTFSSTEERGTIFSISLPYTDKG